MTARAAIFASLIFGSALWAQGLPQREHCPQVQVAALGQPSPGRVASFAASRLEDLVFTVLLAMPIREEHTLSLRLYTPSGALYQTLDLPVAPPGKTPGERALKGYPFSVKEVPARPVGNSTAQHTVEVRFPVGGTLIIQNGLYGVWRAVPYLDGAKEPCGSGVSFRLLP